MVALRGETAHWIETGGVWNAAALASAAGAQTRRAFDARRDAAQPFGAYEFALRTPPSKQVRLAATKWERVLKAPALVWMEHFLGIAARGADDDPTPWSRALGQWSHAWLRAISDATERNTFAPLPPPTRP